jgi:hypothetical protein
MTNPYLVTAPAPTSSSRRFWLALIGGMAVLLAGFIVYCVHVANGPDETLVFVREVHGDVAPAVLAERLSSLKEWSKWFYITGDAQLIDSSSRPLPEAEQVAKTGGNVRFLIDPKKGEHRKFEILAKIREYTPSKKLDLEVLDDSKGMLFRLFDAISWTIEVTPEGSGFLVRGTETAHTANWRSRLFGKISERILMHQIFYPDLMKLAASHPPVSPDEDN